MRCTLTRTEDRNGPGSKGSNAGSGIDRYYLHVFTDPSNPAGSTVLLVNGDANPLNVVAIETDDGNSEFTSAVATIHRPSKRLS